MIKKTGFNLLMLYLLLALLAPTFSLSCWQSTSNNKEKGAGITADIEGLWMIESINGQNLLGGTFSIPLMGNQLEFKKHVGKNYCIFPARYPDATKAGMEQEYHLSDKGLNIFGETVFGNKFGVTFSKKMVDEKRYILDMHLENDSFKIYCTKFDPSKLFPLTPR